MSKKIIKCQNDTIRRHLRKEIELSGWEADLNHLDVSEVTALYGLFANY